MGKYRSMHWTYSGLAKSGEPKPKMAFETIDEALHFARVNGKTDLQPYICDVCCKWHLGHHRNK